jgi:hypothetical protein
MKNFLRKHYPYLLAGFGCFLVGAYFWKVANTGQQDVGLDYATVEEPPQRNSVLVEIGDATITSDDLDFEFSLQTRGVTTSEDLTPIPDLGARYERELSPLKQGLLSSMIERKLLYKYIQEHTKFDLEDPKRYTQCLDEWQKTVADPQTGIGSQSDRERLKQRLCEKSIVEQYLAEETYPKIVVSDQEIKAYYDTNREEFDRPGRILIRQIVLADEKSAKDAQVGLNRLNFASRAKELSITPEAEQGGLLGPYTQTELPRVFDVAFTMRTGDIYGILKSTYGFHLIMLEKKLPAEKQSLASATPVIKEKLLQTKKEEIFQQWVETALDSVQVKSPKPLW